MSKYLPPIRLQARGLILNDAGELFLVRGKSADGSVAEHLALPGGGVDEGESLVEACKRELSEELGVRAEVGRLLFIQQYRNFKHENDACDFMFEITNWRDFLGARPPAGEHGADEIAEFGFFDVTAVLVSGGKILPEFLAEIDLRDFMKNHRETAIYDNFPR
ncbi:MAG: NUDIX hydrolase [Candidatus Nomurabacteria bacterium]|jgi:mutator protein MutT|nr:NUDIX hydrolase [Candidatus Nomurabacteria bacterium]